MDRQEISNIIADARKKSGVTMKELCLKLDCLPGDVLRIEKGKYSYNLQRCILFLNAIGQKMVVSNADERYPITEYDALVTLLIDLRTSQGRSKYWLAAAAGCTTAAITNYEKKKNIISIDMLLKLTSALGFQINISSN